MSTYRLKNLHNKDRNKSSPDYTEEEAYYIVINWFDSKGDIPPSSVLFDQARFWALRIRDRKCLQRIEATRHIREEAYLSAGKERKVIDFSKSEETEKNNINNDWLYNEYRQPIHITPAPSKSKTEDEETYLLDEDDLEIIETFLVAPKILIKDTAAKLAPSRTNTKPQIVEQSTGRHTDYSNKKTLPKKLPKGVLGS
jgi:hypothetical protein